MADVKTSPPSPLCDNLSLLKLLTKLFWGKANTSRAEIFKQYNIEIPSLNPAQPSWKQRYTAIELPAQLRGLLPIHSPSIMVRKDYIDLALHIKMENQPGYRGAVVTGQPGIGKSYFLYYLLIERVLEGKVTAWHVDSTEGIYLLLGPGDVVLYPGTASNLAYNRYPGAWALTDSNTSIETPHPRLTSAHSSFFVVQATSPIGKNWKGWRKECRAALVVMSPWSWEEIFIGGMKFERNISVDQLKKAFTLWGGSARQCLWFSRFELEMAIWERKVPTLLSFHPNLSVLVNSLMLCDHRTDELLSSDVFCIVPLRNRYPTPSLVSAFAASLVVKALERTNPRELRRLYEIFKREPETLYAAQWLLDACGSEETLTQTN